MRIYVPDYYKEFECIKGKCKHSCCIGWEIDIDDDTLSYYRRVDNQLGNKLLQSISCEPTPHFVLSEGERCPFLNSSNLCDIYINLGKEHLCEICSNHPRYVNVFSHREEWGLGMCCEAVAHIILNKKTVTKMVCEGEDNHKEEIIAVRERILSILQDRSKSLQDRFDAVLKSFDIDFPDYGFHYWREVFTELEILDDKWKKYLERDKAPDYILVDSEEFMIPFEQLAVYFVLRYINKQNEQNLKGWLGFCYLSVYMIREVFSMWDKKDMDSLEDICRMYSAEIEYSTDNTDELMMELI